MALFSMSSMTKFAKMGDTGEPTGVSKYLFEVLHLECKI